MADPTLIEGSVASQVLSLRARGLLAFLRKHPELPLNGRVLRLHLGEGRTAIEHTLRELERAGLTTTQGRGAKGRFTPRVLVAPCSRNPGPVDPGPVTPAPEPTCTDGGDRGGSSSSVGSDLEVGNPNVVGDAPAHSPRPLFSVPLEDHAFWSNGRAAVLVRLRQAGVPDDLLDPRFAQGIDAMTEGTGVFWDDELIQYQVWWADQPPSGRKRKRRVQFANWIRRAMATDRAAKRREATRADQGRRPYNPR